MPKTTEPSDTKTEGPRIVPMRGAALRSAARKAAIKTWLRQHFSQAQMVAAFRSLLWVAPLTILIWIYAEREQLVQETVSVPIEVTSSSPDRVVTLVTPSDKRVTAVLNGPHAQVQQVRDKLDYRMNGVPVQIEIDKNLAEGLQQIPTSRVGEDQRFVAGGLTVSKPEPPFLEVYIDKVVKREVPVEAPPDFKLLRPVFDPPRVTVSGPERDIKLAEERKELVAIAAIDPTEIQPNKHSVQPAVKVSLPKYPKILVAPTKVVATFEPTQADFYPIPYVPVQMIAAPELTHDFEIQLRPEQKTVPNVVVVGPKQEIDKFRQSNPPKVLATFEIPATAQLGDSVATVRFIIPPELKGVTVKEDAPVSITYTLVRR